MMSLLGFAILVIVPLLLKADCRSSTILGPDGSSCYYIVGTSMDYNMSSMACQLNYGAFPLVFSAHENAALLGFLKSQGLKDDTVWLGFTAVNGTFVAPDGTPATYTNFYDTPSTLPGSAVVMSLVTGEWATLQGLQAYPQSEIVCVVQNPCQASNSTLPPIGYSTPSATTKPPIGKQCASNHKDASPCPDDTWKFFARTCSCYKTITSTYFLLADQVCQQLNPGTRLSSIHSSEEAVFVADLARNTADKWQLRSNGQDNVIIGLHRVAGQWSWTDGSVYDYQLNWWANQTTNSDYGQLILTNPDGLYSLAQSYDCQNNVCRSAVCKFSLNW